MSDLLRRLLGSSSGSSHPLEGGGDNPLPVVRGDLARPDPVHPKVLAIIHNPTIRARGGQKAQVAYHWKDPDQLAKGYISDLREVSGGYLDYQIAERIDVNDFPVKQDGYRYTDESFDRAWNSRQFHQPDVVDYLALVREFRMIEKVNAGAIDEVWLLGFPYCGYYESIMAGPGAFWCNAPPLGGTQSAQRRFVIMGFNYERGVGEMLEDMGHRAESMLSKVFERTRGEANLWERFIRYDKTHPGRAECGNVHFAPNSLRDYDWGNPRTVPSRCDTWYRFPDLNGEPRMVNGAEWGNGDIRKHHVWWMKHFPHFVGSTNNISWNWWEYIVDPNRVSG